MYPVNKPDGSPVAFRVTSRQPNPAGGVDLVASNNDHGTLLWLAPLANAPEKGALLMVTVAPWAIAVPALSTMVDTPAAPAVTFQPNPDADGPEEIPLDAEPLHDFDTPEAAPSAPKKAKKAAKEETP